MVPSRWSGAGLPLLLGSGRPRKSDNCLELAENYVPARRCAVQHQAVRDDLEVVYAVAQRCGSACAMRNGLSEALRRSAMELESRAWERGGTGRGNCSVQILSVVLISHTDVIANES